MDLGFRPVPEYPCYQERAWKVDLAFPDQQIAIEVEGRWHLISSQHRKDCEKLNLLAAAGWTVLRYPAAAVKTKSRLPMIAEQIARVLCDVHDTALDAGILTGPIR